MKALLALTLGQTEKEGSDKLENVKDLLFLDGMVMPRPRLFGEDGASAYPDLEDQLEPIRKTIEDLQGKKNPIPTNTGKKPTDPDNYNPFSPKGGMKDGGSGRGGNQGGDMGTGPVGSPGPGIPNGVKGRGGNGMTPGGPSGVDYTIPDYTVVRFLDDTVEEGKTYEYRIRFIIGNPNHNRKNVIKKSLAENEELTSDWFLIPQRVSVPTPLKIYACEQSPDGKRRPNVQRKKDQVMLQMHRWIDTFYPNPNNKVREGQFSAGEWVVADRIMANRGEYIAEEFHRTYVPIWDIKQEHFTLYGNYNRRTGRVTPTPVPVRFPPEGRHLLLVDFEGGYIKHTTAGGRTETVEVPVEVAILDEQGNLIVRHQDRDEEDPERINQRKVYIERTDKLRNELNGKTQRAPGTGGVGGAGGKGR
jgi:hypothetical protein